MAEKDSTVEDLEKIQTDKKAATEFLAKLKDVVDKQLPSIQKDYNDLKSSVAHGTLPAEYGV